MRQRVAFKTPSEVDELCPDCSAIDFDAILAHPNNEKFYHDLSYIFKTATRQVRQCTLCQLFLSVVPRVTSTDCLLRAYHTVSVLGESYSNPRAVVLAILLERIDTTIYHFEIAEALSRGRVFIPTAGGSQPSEEFNISLEAREVSPINIRYDLLKDWIDACRCPLHPSHRAHSKCGDLISTLGPRKVIDCQELKIVPWEQEHVYICLSYVWGKPKGEITYTTKAEETSWLLSRPQTIQDAIEVVKRLGQRYLWVDQYCIDQENQEEKMGEIERMDQIYENALATIVALGPDADYGLPGVSHRARAEQLKVHTIYGTLRSTLPDLGTHIRASVWNTRGWTYQEAQLSRRCLFFSDDQVFFACKSGTHSESIDLSNVAFTYGDDRSLNAVLLNYDSRNRIEHPDLLCRQIREYTQKSLSYPSDSLNAFRGILRSAQIYTYFGIPFYTHSNSNKKPRMTDGGFARGLAWHMFGAEPMDPIGGMPSWAWVSYHRKVDYSHMDQEPLRSATFYIQDLKGNLAPLIERPRNSNGTLVLPEPSKILHISTYILPLPLELKFIPREEPSEAGKFHPHRHALINSNGDKSWYDDIRGQSIILDSGTWLTERRDKTDQTIYKSCGALFLYHSTPYLNSCYFLVVEEGGDGTFYRRGLLRAYYSMKWFSRERELIKLQ
jgi:Heterokaryon incompatibility protein (HET)